MEYDIDSSDSNSKTLKFTYSERSLSITNDMIEIIKGKYNKQLLNLYLNGDAPDSIINLNLLYISITGIFNKIDIINRLPKYIRGIGLGKKAYKKLILDFGYISSFSGNKPSIFSRMVWDSLLDDKEVFSFINKNNIICFWNEYEYDDIIDILKKFYKHSTRDEIIFDEDFKIKYNIKDEQLYELIRPI